MRLERTFFIHFAEYLQRVEWGTGAKIRRYSTLRNSMQTNGSAPSRVWRKMVVLVCKHHDGFNLWPTRYSDHSVAASPWAVGRATWSGGCRCSKKYASSWEFIFSRDFTSCGRTHKSSGYYGNESEKLRSAIPTDPSSFKTNPFKGREPAQIQEFHLPVDDYNRYFLNELYELLTEYGPIREVWFDGQSDPSVHEDYDYAACTTYPSVATTSNDLGKGRTHVGSATKAGLAAPRNGASFLCPHRLILQLRT